MKANDNDMNGGQRNKALEASLAKMREDLVGVMPVASRRPGLGNGVRLVFREMQPPKGHR